jgi:hypothetical protein
MKKAIFLLAIAVSTLASCKKSDSPSPSGGSGNGGGNNANDSATYVITASSNHMYALFSGAKYAPGMVGETKFQYNFTNTPGSISQAMPVTVTLKVKNSDSLVVGMAAKNNVPSELTDSNPVWAKIFITRNGITIYNVTKTIQSGTFITNNYTINGH